MDITGFLIIGCIIVFMPFAVYITNLQEEKKRRQAEIRSLKAEINQINLFYKNVAEADRL